MPEISAFSLQTALMPAIMPAGAAPLENAGVPAEPGTVAGTVHPAPSFDALLALQATAQAAAPATSAAATAILPESGKALPDEASEVAAPTVPASLPQAILLKAAIARPSADRTASSTAPAPIQNEEQAEVVVNTETEAVIAPPPDIALFAAIFSAPERLANTAVESPPVSPQARADTAAPTTAAPAVTATTPASVPALNPATPGTVATALASTAQIELIAPPQKGTAARPAPAAIQVAIPMSEPAAEAAEAAPALPVVQPVTVALATSSAAQPLRAMPPVTHGAPASDKAVDVTATKAIASTPEAFTPQLAENAVPGAVIIDAPTLTEASPAAPARSDAKAERIDFATLVDTLNRAREEASPRTLNVAVTNTDFGRVSMRFDSSDAGLSVAMSAADPGFVRAVSASSEAASTSTDTRGQSSQPQTDASAARQQQGQSQGHQQQAGTARSDTRPLANSAPNSRMGDDAASGTATAGPATGDSGIYA